MTFSPEGLEMLKDLEGFRPTLYDDEGVQAIGYGCDLSEEGAALWKDKIMTLEQGEALLLSRVAPVQVTITKEVDVPLNQNQFDALVSLAYNIGIGAFSFSTLLKLLNSGNYAEAQLQFGKWIYAGGKISEALIARRRREATLFATPLATA